MKTIRDSARAPGGERSRPGLSSLLTSAWGVVTGVAPHVLHHVGPLAGAAALAGLGGRVAFYVIGVVASIPMLCRLYRRFSTGLAPAIAVVLFTVMYLFSALVIGPLISSEPSVAPATAVDPHGHD